MKRGRKILSILLAATLLSGIAPTGAQAEGNDLGGGSRGISNGKAIQKGTGVLQESVNTTSAATVYYGLDNSGQSYAYSVIGYGKGDDKDKNGVQTTDSTEKTATLLAKSGYTTTQFNNISHCNYYDTSNLKKKIEEIAEKLTAGEQGAVAARDLKVEYYKPDSPYTDGIKSSTGAAVTGAALWPLSTKEANQVDNSVRALDPENNDTDFWWWLRSPGYNGYLAAFVNGYGSVNNNGSNVDDLSFAVRPAFHLNLDSVLFTSAAESGKSSSAVGGADAISEIGADPGKGWKLTLKDAKRNAFTAETTAINGKKLTVTYAGVEKRTGECISAMIVDDTSGEYTHYGKLKKIENPADASNTVEIDLSKIDMTGKSLYVFNEQDNGDKKTDYASPMRKVKIDPVQYKVTEGDETTWKKGSKEGLTITVGGDYAKFSGLEIDESTVEKEAYTAESGSTVIRLAPEYLEKLSVGSHSITVLYTDGKAEGTFTIADADTSGGDPSDQKTPGSDPSDQKTSGGDTGDSDRSVDPQAGTQPQTGDSNALSLWIMLLLLSLAGIGGTVICGRRKALNSK